MEVIFWCEFPDQCDWKKLAIWLDGRPITIYVTCSSLNDYLKKKKHIQSFSKNIKVNAWSTCPKKEGYWFSGFSSKQTIDRLDEYKGLTLKIDIEPPIPKKYNFFTVCKWLVKNFFFKPKNTDYLRNKILELSKESDIIVSTFPLPNFILKRWGWVKSSKLQYNFMHYSSFIPKILLPFYNLYYKPFLKKHKESYFAVGLIASGIFGNEPTYKNIFELKRDITFLKRNGAKKIVVFRIGAILERGKEWLEASILDRNI